MPSEDVDQSYLKRRQGAADDELARRILAVHPELAPQGADGQAGASNEASAPQRTSVLEMKPPQSPEEAERQRQQIEGAAPELQPTMGPVEGGIYAVAGAPEASLRAIAGTAAALEFQQKAGELAQKLFPNHPAIADFVGQMLGGAALGAAGARGVGKRPEEPAAEEPVKAAPAGGQGPQGGEGGESSELPPGAGEPEGGSAQGPRVAAGVPPANGPAVPNAPPEQVQPQSAEEAAAQAVAAQNPHTVKTMVAQASAAPMTSEQVRALELEGEGQHALLKTPVDAMDTLRLHFYAARQVDEFLAASEAAGGGDPEAAARAQDIARDLAEITLPRWRAALHQAGLNLRVLGDPASAESATIRAAYDAIAGAGGDLDRMVKALAELPTTEQREEMLRQAAEGGRDKLGQNLLNYYVESKLSFGTLARKLTSDAATLLFSVPERQTAEGFGYATRRLGLAEPEATTPPGETLAMIRGAMDGFSDAVRLAVQSVREDRPLFEGAVGYGEPAHQGSPAIRAAGTRFENTPIGMAIDWFGQAVHLPSRGILGVDQFAKAMNFQMQLRALVYRDAYWEAAGQGLSGSEFSEAFAEAYGKLAQKPPPKLVQEASDYARVQTFAQELDTGGPVGKFLAALNKARQTAIGRVVAPFFPTPVNLDRAALEYGGPLALLSKAWRERLMSGGPNRDLALAKLTLGTLMSWQIVKHVADGKINGHGPENPEVRKLWLEEGHQPYAIRLGKHELGNLPEPFSTTLGLLADGVDTVGRLPEPDASKLAGAMLITLSRQLENQSFFQNVVSLIHLLDAGSRGAEKLAQENRLAGEMSPEQSEAAQSLAQGGEGIEGAAREVGRLAASVVPSTAADLAHGIDPIHRQVRGIIDEYKSRIPGFSATLPPQRDLFGRPVVVPLGWNRLTGNLIPLLRVTRINADPVVDELVRVEPTVPALGHDGTLALGSAGAMEKIRATPEQIDAVARARGEFVDPASKLNLHDYLARLIASDEYKRQSVVDQRRVLERVINAYTTAAKAQVFRDHPELRAAYIEQRKARAALRTPAAGTESAGGLGGP